MKPLNEHSREAGIERLQAIVDSASDGLITISQCGAIETFNPACERIFGYDADDIVGQNIKMLVADFPDVEGSVDIAQVLMRDECNLFGRRKDGSLFPMELGLNEKNIQGEVIYIGTIRDISERRNAEIQRQQLMDKLTQSNMELERFAYVASHDMQEPVRMMQSFGKMLAHEYGNRLDETGREYLKFLTDSAERIHKMIDDLLDYARMGSEGADMVIVDGARELEHVLGNLDGLIMETGAQVTFDALPPFPGNPVQIMRLMQNLIANAIKYQPPKNIPKVHVGVEDLNSSWRISIKDNGIGIDEAFTQQIFEPFRRLHSWEHIKGTGIGLAVCRKIVENHGGTIDVSSVPGQGSTFFITLPKPAAERQAA
jgi:two-component system sensor kinase FixL